MELRAIQELLSEIFGEKNVKAFTKGFRVIVNYNNMPYCVVLRQEGDKIHIEKDAIDEDQENYDEAYKMAYRLIIQNKQKFGDSLDI
ncbi:MAG: hypothetical protein QME45_07605 [Clostridiales bacterium]|nr:hypothetical protein [Clostridiales bacterium]HBM80949.1 hypothetical protein [Clostridiaceae bacterium]